MTDNEPYTQPGEKGTDTNQASEVKRNSLNKSDIDVKLDKALGYMTMVWDESGVFGQPPDYSHIYLTGKQEAKTAINALIRTEKLKLLAEVRERVVGEDLPLNTTPDTGQRIYNKVKADERAELTKLGAEL